MTDEPIDLHHHGDREVAAGLVDLAVNVFPEPRPQWLEDAIRSSYDDLTAYPDATRARLAIAARHQRPEAEVLPTSGGAEAFTLIARARPWRKPVVVHPQFTEPEAALVAAGHQVTRVLLSPNLVPDDADLVVVGNPTNPTGTLHPAATVRSLLEPGRVVVVDEAFMDAVHLEEDSLASVRHDGLVVIRSLTKTWSIPGVRAGYVVGDAEIVTDLARQQPPWSVSTSAIAAMVACSSGRAVDTATQRATLMDEWRSVLVDALAEVGLPAVGDPATPFVLVHGPKGLHNALRSEGFAVRRGDTFPGLGPEWIRIAVRDPQTSLRLASAMEKVLSWAAD